MPESSIPSVIPSVHRCARYQPGHSVHWVQARRSWMETDVSELPQAEIISLSGETIVASTGDGIVRYRNHDIERLKLIVAEHGAKVALHERWQLMKIHHGIGSYYICIAKDEGPPLEPCVDPRGVVQPTTVEGLIDKTNEFGGGYLNLGELRRRQRQ